MLEFKKKKNDRNEVLKKKLENLLPKNFGNTVISNLDC